MLNENVVNLTIAHPWMSFEESWLLMKWSYEKNKTQERYGGRKTLVTLMSIDFGIYQRQSREWLEERIQRAKEKFGYLV